MKTRAQSLASILQNAEMLRDVYKSVQESEGSAAKENDVWLQSIEAHTQKLTAKWQEVWDSGINRELVNFFIDLGAGILDVVNDIGVLRSAIIGLSTISSFKKNSVFKIFGVDDSGNFTMFNKQMSELFKKQEKLVAVNNTQANTTISGYNMAANNATSESHFNSIQQAYVKSWENNNKTMSQYFASLKQGEQASLTGYKNYVKQMNAQTGKLSSSFKSLGKFSKQMGAMVLNAFTAMAVSYVVSGIITVVQDLINYEKQLGESAKAAADAVNSEKEQLNDFKTKIQACYDVLNDSNSSYEDSVQAHKDLYDIKNQLMQIYPNEAKNIDLVTSGIQKQKEAIEELEKASGQKAYSDYMYKMNNELNGIQKVYKVAGSIMTFGHYSNEDAQEAGNFITGRGINTNLELMKKEFENFSMSMSMTTNETVNSMIAAYDNIKIDNNKFIISGNADKVNNTILEIQSKIKTLPGYAGELDNQLQKVYDDSNKIVETWGSSYNAYLESYANSNYFELIDGVESAYNDFIEAETKGNSEAIEDAKEKYVNAIKDVKNSDALDSVKDFIITLHPEMDTVALEEAKIDLNNAVDQIKVYDARNDDLESKFQNDLKSKHPTYKGSFKDNDYFVESGIVYSISKEREKYISNYLKTYYDNLSSYQKLIYNIQSGMLISSSQILNDQTGVYEEAATSIGITTEELIQILEQLGYINQKDGLFSIFKKATTKDGILKKQFLEEATQTEKGWEAFIEIVNDEGIDKLEEWDVSTLQKIFNKKIKEITTVNNSVLNDKTSISDSISNLSKQMTPYFSAMESAYTEIFTSDGFTRENINNEMLENLRKQFEEASEDFGTTIDTDKMEDFFKVLADGSKTADDVQQAFNDLATEWLYCTSTIEDLNDETADLMRIQLKGMGIVNYDELVDSALEYANAQREINKAISLYNPMLEEEIERFNTWETYDGKKLSEKYNIDNLDFQYGNINMNNREVIKYTEDYLDAWETALKSWVMETDEAGNVIRTYYDDVADAINNGETMIDTVFGGALNTKNDLSLGINFDVAYSPILQTETGATFLSQDALYNYIGDIINNAKEQLGDNYSTEDLFNKILELDATGLQDDAYGVGQSVVKNMIAGISDQVGNTSGGINAIDVSELLHFSGDNGAVALAKSEISPINQIVDVENKLIAIQEKYNSVINSAASHEKGYVSQLEENIAANEAESDAIGQKIQEYYNEINATEEVKEAIFKLAYQEWLEANINANTSQKCSALLALAKQYLGVAEAAKYAAKAEYYEKVMQHAGDDTARESAKANLDKLLNPEIEEFSQPVQVKWEPKDDSGSGSGDSNDEKYKDELDVLAWLRDQNFINESEYLDQLRILYEKYYGDLTQYSKEYYEHEKEYLDGKKDLYTEALSSIISLFDKEISKIDEEKEKRIEALEKEQKALEKPLEARKEALEDESKELDKQIKEIDKQIKAQDKLIEAKQKEIDAINDAREARQKDLDLQKAEYEFEKAKNQRTKLVYTDEKGYHYEADTSAVKDAQENLNNTKEEYQIYLIEKEKEALEDAKEKLEESKELLEDQKEILSEQIELIDEELDKISKSYEKQKEIIEEYYKTLTDPIEDRKKLWQDMQDDIELSEILDNISDIGLSAEDILNGSLIQLNKWKTGYLGIMGDLYKNDEGMSQAIKEAFAVEELGSYIKLTEEFQKTLDEINKKDYKSGIASVTAGGTFGIVDGLDLAYTKLAGFSTDYKKALNEIELATLMSISNIQTAFSLLQGDQTNIDIRTDALKALGVTSEGALTAVTELSDEVSGLIEEGKLLVEDATVDSELLKEQLMAYSEEVSAAIVADAQSATSQIQESINSLEGKEVEITIKTKKVWLDDTTTGVGKLGGTAYVGGKWQAGKDSTALVGEEGLEIVAHRSGTFDIVGKDGAEFTNIKHDDVVFDAKQSAALLNKGKINSRGKAYAGGKDNYSLLSASDPEKYKLLTSFTNFADLVQQPILEMSKTIVNNAPVGGTAKPVENINISIGDINLTGVQDVNGLSKAIVSQLPNQLLQTLNKR